MNTLSQEQLSRLPTKRLLAYKRILNRSYYYFDPDFDSGCGCPECDSRVERNKTKAEHFESLKTILSTREHVPKKLIRRRTHGHLLTT